MGLKRSRSEKVKIIVCDAGPVIHLHEAGILPLLQKKRWAIETECQDKDSVSWLPIRGYLCLIEY